MSGFGLNREEALSLLNQHIKNLNLKRHCLATEAIMRRCAEFLGEDPETWGLVGLLHDLDYEETKDSPERHTLVTAEILRQKGVPEEHIKTIISHNEAVPDSERKQPVEYLLASADNITGLIVAAVLVLPDRKLASLKPKSVRKRMKEKAFARSVDRQAIQDCEKAGIPLDEFIQLSVSAMQSIAEELGF